MTAKEVLNSLNSSLNGLAEKQIAHRTEKFGKNKITIKKELSFIKLLLIQFKSYLVWLLILISAFAFFTGFYLKKEEQIINGIIIAIIVLINVLIGSYQDYKSEKSAQTLESMIVTEALVKRGGKTKKINAEELVPGDIIMLSEGDKVPADCRIIESHNLRVDESMLTGESKEVTKTSTPLNQEVPLAERKNMIFMNTFIIGGTATCIVVRTGRDTEVGKIAESLEIKEESPFIKEVDQASKRITYVALLLILSVLIIYYFKQKDWISMFMIGSALVVGAIPEGLPAIVTFSLALSSLKLARKNVLIKRKTLLETLGSIDVICTDKTGTLTENKMTVKKIYLGLKTVTNLNNLSEELKKQFANCALLANESKNTIKGFKGSAEDISLIDLFNKEGYDILRLRNDNPYLDLKPFSSETRKASSINIVGNKIIKYAKGSPETILEESNYYLDEKGVKKKLTDKVREKINAALKNYSKDSLRNIAFSYKIIKNDYNPSKTEQKNKIISLIKKENEKTDSENIFLGIVGIYDPPKQGVKETIKTIYEAGIEIKMITGDNAYTATAIAKECGFKNIKAISWDELKDLSEEKLKKAVEECNVFARMSPEYKLKIVSAIQENNHRVAITGDGVNDVPALKKAEVGIAMGMRGTDIAKEASDMILMNDNLKSVVEGIKTGRTIFSNIRKVINYLLTANLSEVFVVFLGAMFNVIPFSAIQLLWVNFVTDTAPAMALASDPPHKNIMKKKPTGKNEQLINKRITLLTIFIGIKKVILIFLLFYLIYWKTGNLVIAQTASFTWLVLSHFVRIAAIRFDEKVNLLQNKYVNWSVIIPVILQLIILYTPLSEFFQTARMGLIEWALLIISFIIALVLAKIITYFIDKLVPQTESDY